MGHRALAIVNMLIYVVVFTIVSGVILSVIANQTRLMENRVRLVKAQYATESAIIEYVDGIRRGVYSASVAQNVSFNVPWNYNPLTNTTTTRAVTVSYVPNAGINGTALINATLASVF